MSWKDHYLFTAHNGEIQLHSGKIATLFESEEKIWLFSAKKCDFAVPDE